MLFGIFKKNPEYIDVDAGQKMNKKNKMLALVIVGAIAVLALSSVGGDKEQKEINLKENENSLKTEKYIKENEKRLEEIISSIQGAGQVRAMLTLEDVGEKMIATDKKSTSSQEIEEKSTSKSMNQENSALVFGSGSEEKPFVIKEKLPKPSGVLIVASGAGDESVRLEIYEAVKALFGISGHRIKVTKGIIK